jgi:hypothetical protein
VHGRNPCEGDSQWLGSQPFPMAQVIPLPEARSNVT